MRGRGTHWLGTAGSILALLAPKGLCPICIAASGGALSSVGLGFLADDRVVRWLLPGALLVGLVGLLLSARVHKRWWIFVSGCAGAVTLYVGWFLTIAAMLYVGTALLVGASVCNIIWRRPAEPLVQIGKVKVYGKA
jgi:hypothetical protein